MPIVIAFAIHADAFDLIFKLNISDNIFNIGEADMFDFKIKSNQG